MWGRCGRSLGLVVLVSAYVWVSDCFQANVGGPVQFVGVIKVFCSRSTIERVEIFHGSVAIDSGGLT